MTRAPQTAHVRRGRGMSEDRDDARRRRPPASGADGAARGRRRADGRHRSAATSAWSSRW